MPAGVNVRLFEPTDPRLGRHQIHDGRSRSFALEPVRLPTRRVLHERHIDIFDQGELGCCTACAQLGMLATGPLNLGKAFTLEDVHQLYRDETRLDDREIPGEWEPDDTGSAGIYACKVAAARRWIRDYRHAFAFTTALGWLGQQPISVGIPWYASMFDTDRHGLVTVDRRSAMAGGHQICWDGIDPRHSLVRFAQSWGPGWGDHGWGWLTYADAEWLMRQGGDAVTVTLH